MRIPSLVLIAALVAAGGCDNQPTEPTVPQPTSVSELFSGTLDAQGSGFYSFSLNTQSTVGLTLASVTPTLLGSPLPAVLTLGLGIPRGIGCALTTSQNVGPGLSAQISTTLEPGTYCVNLADPGTLPATATFVVRITRAPTSLTPPAPEDPTTMTFASNVTVGGTASRTFTSSQPGTVSLTLESAGPPSGVVLGIGVGIVRLDGSCGLSRAVTTAAGSSPQFETPVDVGRYCVRVFDTGALTDITAFSLRVVHP
jgi:hypothetical protein